MATETEHKQGLLERVAVAAEGLAEKALHKLEEIAPAAVAGPVHAVAEAAANLLPHHQDAQAEQAPKTEQPDRAPASVTALKAAPPESAPAKMSRPAPSKPAAVAAKPEYHADVKHKKAVTEPGVFKVKRGQKH